MEKNKSSYKLSLAPEEEVNVVTSRRRRPRFHEKNEKSTSSSLSYAPTIQSSSSRTMNTKKSTSSSLSYAPAFDSNNNISNDNTNNTSKDIKTRLTRTSLRNSNNNDTSYSTLVSSSSSSTPGAFAISNRINDTNRLSSGNMRNNNNNNAVINEEGGGGGGEDNETFLITAHRVNEPILVSADPIIIDNNKEEEQREMLKEELKKSQRCRWFSIAGILCIIFGIIIVLSVMNINNDDGKKEEEKDLSPTLMPTLSSNAIEEYINSLYYNTNYDYDNEDDETSSQYRAYQWLLNIHDVTTNDDDGVDDDDAFLELRTPLTFDIIRQQYVLAVLYYSTGGDDSWIDNDNWLSSSSSSSTRICSWYSGTSSGSVCNNDENGLLTILDLNRNNMTGTIPTELGLLSNDLRVIEFSFNNLYGTIPTELGVLTNLEILHLPSNIGLTGTVPTELGNLRNVKQLYVDANPKLSGIIPQEICQLKPKKEEEEEPITHEVNGGSLTKLWADCGINTDTNNSTILCTCCRCCSQTDRCSN